MTWETPKAPSRKRVGYLAVVRRLLARAGFAAELADLCEQGRAVAGEMIAEEDLPWRMLQELIEGRLAVKEGAASQIPAVVVEEVEGVIGQRPAAAAESGVEQVQVRDPALVRHGDFAV